MSPDASQARTGNSSVTSRLLVGSSAIMTRVRRRIEDAARGHGVVFVVGESGTGKEIAARTLHELSAPRGEPLVVVNCATLPRELMESELFGHKRGAFTGADHPYEGLVRAARGGTLFLDEVTEMTLEGQAKLLRVLEEGAIRPVGTVHEIPVHARFVASTNRDPVEAVRSGALREDLYHRLNAHLIHMPPLREHIEDLHELVAHFCAISAKLGGVRDAEFSAEALTLCRAYHWPGNVRELRNTVAAALSKARGAQVECRDLPSAVRRGSGTHSPMFRDIPTIAEAERRLMERALEATGGNKLRAAKLLGISRHRLYDKIKKFEINATKHGKCTAS